MGTHPIFESDFDCLTENGGEFVKITVAFEIEVKVAFSRAFAQPIQV